jgi:hypothetical protein
MDRGEIDTLQISIAAEKVYQEVGQIPQAVLERSFGGGVVLAHNAASIIDEPLHP